MKKIKDNFITGVGRYVKSCILAGGLGAGATVLKCLSLGKQRNEEKIKAYSNVKLLLLFAFQSIILKTFYIFASES